MKWPDNLGHKDSLIIQTIRRSVMTQQKTRKQRVMFSVEQKLDYVKLMINEGYTNRQIIEISGAGPTAVARWKKQYLAELNGLTQNLLH